MTKTRAAPILGSSVLVPGPNRFVFGLIDVKTGVPVKDVTQVDAHYYKLSETGDTGTKINDAQAIYRSEGLPLGVCVTRTEFTQPGAWGALLIVRPRGAAPYAVQLPFRVVADSPVPRVGQAAPRSRNLIGRDDPTLATIDSARPHDGMHELTIADAVQSRKPTVILFATPGFCETATCGPDLQVAQALQARYGDRANFIHIETPSNAAAPQGQRPTMDEWQFTSEPWLILVDRDGVIAERFEGGLTVAEVEPALQKVLE